MEAELKRVIRIILGVVILIAGIAGLFLPFLQGIIMIILGIHLISPEKGKIIVEKGKKLFNEKFRGGKSG